MEDCCNLGTTETAVGSTVDIDSNRDWVAIVGMACRFPQANSLKEYWDILSSGRNTSSVPPSHRTSLVDMDPEIKANFLKCHIDQFDAGFFGMSPSECKFTDPQARLLLEVSWEAFEHAGISPERMRGSKSGVFCGTWLQEYKEAINDQAFQSPGKDFLQKYLGNGFGCTAAKLSHFYGFTGPNISTESGCSSSMTAVDMAIKSLQREECSLAVACGANIIINLGSQRKLWAEDGLSRAFDASADGYGRAEGVAVLIMKRYCDAVKDKDLIHGIIRGSAVRQEGLSKSFGTPTVESESLVMREALAAANVPPEHVDYLEAHATGTRVGDPTEAAAIVQAYSVPKGKRLNALIIGSGKTNIGHTESCSGLAGIIKVILSMKHETIPRHINVTNLRPKVDFSAIPGAIPLNSVPWPRRKQDSPRIAGVSSFGITGTDVHVIIQEPPSPQMRNEIVQMQHNSKDVFHLLTISAKSKHALDQFKLKFCSYLETANDSIEDITYTTNVCRPHHNPFRIAVLGKDVTEIIKKIKNGDNLSSVTNTSCSTASKVLEKPKICFTFPGRIGVWDFDAARRLYEAVPFFKETVDSCCNVFSLVTGYSLSLHSDKVMESSSSASLARHGLLIISQYSLAKLWMHWGLCPTSVMGHCLGEISAAVVCGALDLENAFKLITFTRHFSQHQPSQPCEMLAVNASHDFVKGSIATLWPANDDGDQWIDVACVNSTSQTVVVGPKECVEMLKIFCDRHKIRYKTVPIEYFVHSRAVERACQESFEGFNKIVHRSMSIPYISSVTGSTLKNSDMNGKHWYKVFRDTVNYQKACKSVGKENLGGIFIEMGLNGALTELTKENLSGPNKTLCVASLPGKGILSTVGRLYTAGASLNWKKVMETGYQHQRVVLPGYPFQRKSFWFERNTKLQNLVTAPTAKILHPLLGVCVENPVGIEHIVCFRNEWFSELEGEQLEYIQDHIIGTKVVFPGAAFLEMILSACKYAQEMWNNSLDQENCFVTVENFNIIASLVFGGKSTPKRLQTVVNKETCTVHVYSSNGIKSEWKLHASANYIAGVQAYNDVTLLKMIGGDTEDTINFYTAVAQVGLNFGKMFKSLKGIRRLPKSKDVLVHVNLSFDENILDAKNDVVTRHPILMDAMIQAFMVSRKPQLKKLYVPVKIGRFTALGRNKCDPTTITTTTTDDNENVWYVYCQGEENKTLLLNEHGHVLAVMENLELVATSVESIIGTEEQETANENGSVGLYDVTWQPSKCFIEPRDSWILFHYGNVTKSDIVKLKKISGCEIRTMIMDPSLGGCELKGRIIQCLQDSQETLETIIFWFGMNQERKSDIIFSNPRNVVEPLLCITKYLIHGKFNKLPKFYLVTNDTWAVDDGNLVSGYEPASALAWGFMRNVRIELPGIVSKSIDLQGSTPMLTAVEQVAKEVWEEDRETEVAYRNETRHVRRLEAKKKSTASGLCIPDDGMYQVELPSSKMIADVRFVRSCHDSRHLLENQVEVEVRCVSLNFKDALSILKPSREFEGLTSIGLDYSGVISKVGAGVEKWEKGDAVFGVNWGTGCMKSHLETEENLLMAMPNTMSFAEAATLPAVFLTAWHCMVNVARLTSRQSILVHAASGGVGLAAIQIAKLLGVRVIGTAGSERKRRFLRGVGVEHVFSSRSLVFKEQVKTVTGGDGVDMVLNCLTGQGFKEASLDVCRDGGYFVEISKLNTWMEAQVREKRPLVNYTVVDLTKVSILTVEDMMKKLLLYLTEEKIKPLHYISYSAPNLVEALTYLQKAQHIGKVIVNMPHKFENVRKELLFNDRSSYLITGGLGAIGFSVCKWMISQQGAKYVVLVGRSVQADEKLQQEISLLEKQYSAKVTYKQVDIAEYSQCEKLVKGCRKNDKMPPLRGIHHCAGVLSDKMIIQQDWENFDKVLQCKVNGASNLHQLTKKFPLEHFVCHSSAAATFGHVGQVNYVCANAYLDALVQYRRYINLPGLSVNWGQWKAGLGEDVQVDWLLPMSVEQGISCLEKIMKEQQRRHEVGEVVAGNFNFSRILNTMPYYGKTLLESLMESNLQPKTLSKVDSCVQDSASLGRTLKTKYSSLKNEEEKMCLVREFVVKIVCDTLGVNHNEVAEDVDLSEMGMDSIMSIEFVNRVSSSLGDNEESKQFFIDLDENKTVRKLTTVIFGILANENCNVKSN